MFSNAKFADAKMYFCVHFPKENVQLCKNAFDAKMHLMPKCILATQRITFSKGKCSAKQNVTNAFDALLQNAFWHQMHFASNAFDAKMHLMPKYILATQRNATRTFSKGKCSAVQKCCVFCFAKNKDAYILFCNIFLWKMYAKMHFCIKCIFAPTKCYKCI